LKDSIALPVSICAPDGSHFNYRFKKKPAATQNTFKINMLLDTKHGYGSVRRSTGFVPVPLLALVKATPSWR
jgi:hypothetical protein